MSVLKLQEVKYSDDKRALSYEFIPGKLYSIFNNNTNNEHLTSLFHVIANLRLPPRGEVLWRNIDIKKLNPSMYRSNMVTIIPESNTFVRNMKVINYLKYVTNNFESLYDKTIEFIDYLELVYSLFEEFGFNKESMKKRIKKLDHLGKWQLKLVETLLTGNEVLLINRTLDFYDEELLNFCINSLYQMVEKYNLCVITFTEREDIASKLGYQINL